MVYFILNNVFALWVQVDFGSNTLALSSRGGGNTLVRVNFVTGRFESCRFTFHDLQKRLLIRFVSCETSQKVDLNKTDSGPHLVG